jgi:1-acyl-sn-glycerol-3-phosphate acyltransferase
MNASTGSRESCAKILREGNIMVISPGGVYEAQFGDSNYEILWQKRTGFAKVAIEAKVPIIPMFTENLREGYRNASFGASFFEKIYNSTRLPLRPVYGSFPVKLRTYLGKPIPYDPNLTPEELQQKVARAIEDLIAKNQRIPGKFLEALKDRFRDKQPIDVAGNLKIQKKYVLKI